MAYIPGPGAKEKKPATSVESVPVSIEEKPLKRYYEERARLRKKEKSSRKTPLKEGETSETPVPEPKTRIPATRESDGPKRATITGTKRLVTKQPPTFVWTFLFFVALAFSIFSYMKLHEFRNTYATQLDALKQKSEERFQTLNKMIMEDRAYLGPNGIIDKYLVVSNNIDSQIIGLNDMIALSESRAFDKVGFVRFFISGSKPVWVSVESSSGKVVFQNTLSPGLSREMIYYFKKPAQAIQNITFEVTQNFKVSSGNYENTYLVFFSFGTTKIVRMDSKTISNPVQKYNIWIPSTT